MPPCYQLDQLFETVEEEAESAQSSTSSSTPTQAPAAVTPKPQQLPLLPTPKVAAVAAAGSGEEGAATAKAHLLELAQVPSPCGVHLSRLEILRGCWALSIWNMTPFNVARVDVGSCCWEGGGGGV